MNEAEFSEYKEQVEQSLRDSPIGDWILKQQALGFTPWQILSAMKLAGWQESLAQGLIERMLIGKIFNPSERPAIPNQSSHSSHANPHSVAPKCPTLNWEKTQKTLISHSESATQCRVVSHYRSPEIVVLEDVLSPLECSTLLQQLSAQIEATKPHFLGFRQAYVPANQHPNLLALSHRMADLFSWPKNQMDSFQISHIPKNGYIEPHYDFFHPDHPDTKLLTAAGGQRIATAIIFLQEAASGGALQFPELGLSMIPRLGSAVFFSYPQLSSASKALNGVMPVIDGVSVYLSTWFRTEAL